MAAPQLIDLISPAHTALLTMECQRGVVGDLAELPDLAEAANKVGTIGDTGTIAKLCNKAREVGATVVHCNAENYFGGVGASRNCRLLAAGAGWLIKGEPSTELLPELNYQDTDLIVGRAHGVTPFTSTSLDQVLRNMEIKTVITVGHSVNVGLLGMVLTAVDLGYQVVVPQDAVAGVPVEYGEQVIEHTLSYLATICNTDEILSTW